MIASMAFFLKSTFNELAWRLLGIQILIELKWGHLRTYAAKAMLELARDLL